MADEQPPQKGFFTDDEGSPSSMRLMSFVSLLLAGALAGINALGWGSPDSEHVLYFLVAAFAPKTVQKFVEKKK